MGKENKSVFILLFIINFVITAGYSVSDSLFPVLFGGLVGHGVMLGMAFVLYSAAKVIFGPLVGRLLDRHGEIQVLGTSLMMYIVVSIIFLVSKDGSAVLAARVVQGAACAMFRPVIYAMVGRRTSKKRLGRVSGLMDVSFYSALAAGPMFGGYLTEYYGVSSVLMCLAAMCAAALILFSLLVVQYKSSKQCEEQQEYSGYRNASGAVFSGLLIYIFFRAWGISTVSIYLPIFMNENGFKTSQIGLTAGSAAAVTALSLIFTGRLSDTFNRCFLLSAGGIISAVMIICMPSVHSTSAMICAAGVSGFFSAVSQPAGVSLLIEHASNEGSGQALANFNTVMNMGFITSPLINSLIYGFLGVWSVFIISGLMIIGAVGVFLIVSSLSMKEMSPEAGKYL